MNRNETNGKRTYKATVRYTFDVDYTLEVAESAPLTAVQFLLECCRMNSGKVLADPSWEGYIEVTDYECNLFPEDTEIVHIEH